MTDTLQSGAESAVDLDKLRAALKRVCNAALPVTNAAYNMGQSHEQWDNIKRGIDELDAARRAAHKLINPRAALARRATAPRPVEAAGSAVQDDLAAALNAAVDNEYPLPDNPHASVIQRATDNRAAMWRGINAARKILATHPAEPVGAPLPRYNIDAKGLPLADPAGVWVAHSDLPAVGGALVAKAEQFEEIRALLNETYRFASTSPTGKRNINAALDLLDDIEESATGALVAVKDEPQDQAKFTDEEICKVRAAKRGMVNDLIASNMNYGKCGVVSHRLEKLIEVMSAESSAAPTESAAAPAEPIGPRWDDNGEPWNEAAEKVEQDQASVAPPEGAK